jgi:hypothetical protein
MPAVQVKMPAIQAGMPATQVIFLVKQAVLPVMKAPQGSFKQMPQRGKRSIVWV